MPEIIVKEHFPLQSYNTFHFSIEARYFCSLSQADELRLLSTHQLVKTGKFCVMGGGSNLLFTGDYDGLVVHVCNQGIEVLSADNHSVTIKVAAGENWHEFVSYCVENGYGGIENLSLIPGNVGSCPIQNIGAYGVEVKDAIQSVEVFDLQQNKFYQMLAAECEFGYRESIFKRKLKGKCIVWSVTFKLNLQHKLNIDYGAISDELKREGITTPGIADVSRIVCNIRRSKLPDPEIMGNAGSFFKNPAISWQRAEQLKARFPEIIMYQQSNGLVKLAAGWLIEQCGWKGFREGDAGVHSKQALVLVNYGKATGKEILTLAGNIQRSVFDRYGVELEMEVNIA